MCNVIVDLHIVFSIIATLLLADNRISGYSGKVGNGDVK